MNADQMRQALEAYYESYQRGVENQWSRSPFVYDLHWDTAAREVPPPPVRQRTTTLPEARPQDKMDAIDVEFRRVR